MDLQQTWQAALGELELSISKANFTTWFKNTFIIEHTEEIIIIGVPNAFTKTWLEKKYHKDILETLKNIGITIKTVEYKVQTTPPNRVASIDAAQATPTSEQPLNSPLTQTTTTPDTGLVDGMNPKYTFNSFVVGKGNELAHAACIAIAKKPGEIYNPLFMYGGVGLGKTHLMQAIGNEIRKSNPEKKVLYVTSEKFTNEFINAVQHGEGKNFKEKYRGVDVLLIDDIQFLAAKEQTQEEFFHTFNTLHQNNKQIVITSDKPPKAIPALEQRLISRFEWGMIADVGAPDLETRIAILQAKCAERNYVLAEDILRYIATTVQNNVRELEGILNKIIAFHQLNNQEPSLESVKSIISSLTTSSRTSRITPKQIVETISEYFDVAVDALTGNSRKKELVIPRQIAMYMMRQELNSSYPNIGSELGGRDHTTAMHACSKITKEIEKNEQLHQDIELIKQRLYT
ncbi:MAG: chromosomal replication initiator protein DnaA [Patescibacteria group bacterium]